MPTETPSSDLAYADTLWKSADTLRGQIDAAEYKHVVLGPLLLKTTPTSHRLESSCRGAAYSVSVVFPI